MSEAKIASMAIFGGTPKGPQGKELKKRCPQARRHKNFRVHDWARGVSRRNSSDMLRLVNTFIVRALIKYNWFTYHKSLLPRYLTIKYKNWLIYQLYLTTIITGFLYQIASSYYIMDYMMDHIMNNYINKYIICIRV